METTGYGNSEKRKHLRVTFPPSLRPTFLANGQAFEVEDISRGGLKFIHRDQIRINGWVQGTISLADGTIVDLEGIVVRTTDKHMGLAFINELPDGIYSQIFKSFCLT